MAGHTSGSSSKADKKTKQQVHKKDKTTRGVWIETLDGNMVEIDRENAMSCTVTKAELDKGHGSSKMNPISLPLVAEAASVTSAFEYWRLLLACSSREEYQPYIQSFLEMDPKKLAYLIIVANHLQLEPLNECAAQAMCHVMRDKSTEEMRQIFELSDNLTKDQEQALQIYPTDGPRVRLLGRLHRKKLQLSRDGIDTVKEPSGAVNAYQHQETRDVDELLSFINSRGGDTSGVQTSKKKKKKSRKGRKQKKNSSVNASSSAAPSSLLGTEDNEENRNASAAGADDLQLPGTQDDNSSSDLDPALNEELDREVEDFARRLNLDIQEIQ